LYTKPGRYLGSPDFRHDEPESLGVLLVNLGTPDAPTTGAVRRFLAEFLADPRVVELPRWLWLPILHGVILRVRPRRSAEAYRSVWTPDGAPLLAIARRQAAALERALREQDDGGVAVALGMRYGRPSLSDALAELHRARARRLLVVPLFPQYSATTTASVFDAVSRELSRWRWIPELRFVTHYHDHPGYIEALASSVREAWAGGARGERLLYSFHGIPRRYFDAGDPYHCQCHKTARLVSERLELAPEQWAVAFQSRVGRERWLEPYTEDLLESWGRSGVQRVDVLCPGFSADCLETIEEIAIRDRELFESAGGESLRYVPALNDRSDHIAALADLVHRSGSGWWRDDGVVRRPSPQELRARADRAHALETHAD